MINLKQIEAEEDRGVVKATIQKSGRLGFSQAAILELALSSEKSISIFINDNFPTDSSLYIKINISQDEGAFTIKKAGEYYYLNTKTFFNKIGVDFNNPSITIIYDIVDIEIDGEQYFKLIRRDKKKRII